MVENIDQLSCSSIDVFTEIIRGWPLGYGLGVRETLRASYRALTQASGRRPFTRIKVCNMRLLTTRLGYLTPAEFEAQWSEQQQFSILSNSKFTFSFSGSLLRMSSPIQVRS
jgi:hypothetical protein